MVDQHLYSKKSPNQKKIEKVIFPLGFESEEETGNNRCYLWFKEENHESLRGCRLCISEVDKIYKDGFRLPKGTRTIFTSTTMYGRSYEDVEMQIRVIRKLRSVFGGSVYDPQRQTYAYINNILPKLSPGEKRCGLIFDHFNDNLGRAIFATDDLDPQYLEFKKLGNSISKMDSGLVRNNLVAVFLVSILETFLKDLFIAYIDLNLKKQETIYEKRSKIDSQKVKELLEGKKSLGGLEADYYNFQNLSSANKASCEYLDINLYKLWNQKKKIGKKFYSIREKVEELIELRHEIVHAAYLEPDFDGERVDQYRTLVESAGKLIVEALEKQGFRIDLEEYTLF